jgi:hypothetical protein
VTARRWRLAALIFALLLLIGTFSHSLGVSFGLFGFIYDFPYGDKIAHFILSGMLGLLAGLGFPPRRAHLAVFHPLVSSLVLGLLITIEELSQISFATRAFDLRDLAAGLLGIFLLGEIGARLNPQGTS